MLSPDEKTVKAIMGLQGNPDFDTIIRWLQQSYHDHLQNLTLIESEVRLRICQGRSQELAELLDAILNAKSFLRPANQRS